MIRVYWKNATAEAVTAEHGVTEAELDGLGERIHAGWQRITGQPNDREGYRDLPGNEDYSRRVKELVAGYRGRVTDLVVLGIGGSALGNIALHAALAPATYNLLPDDVRGGPRLFVLDNVDPAMVGDVLDLLAPRLETTLVNVISKSGETAETAGEFMIFREMLRERLGEAFREHIVATTDAEKGTLHEIAREDGYEMLIVPGDVGGRFCVLSQVGLFSAAMCGIDTDALLAGAADMKARAEAEPLADSWRKNPACILAAVKYLAFAEKHKPMHVMMPYSNRLYLLADWYRQIWAESLGKRLDRDDREVFTGPTPIKALGATDQHSQVQLYREGPNDKLTVFLEVARHPREVAIPDVFGRVEGLAYLRGHALGELLNAEKIATEYAMKVSNRPTVTIRLDEISPHSVGEFIYLYELTTALMGELLKINAYDQPAVELGKQATFALMGRAGNVKPDIAADLGAAEMTYTQLKEQIDAFAKEDEDYLA